jgi:hypothetical protein
MRSTAVVDMASRTSKPIDAGDNDASSVDEAVTAGRTQVDFTDGASEHNDLPTQSAVKQIQALAESIEEAHNRQEFQHVAEIGGLQANLEKRQYELDDTKESSKLRRRRSAS